jgi:hypothetical protein
MNAIDRYFRRKASIANAPVQFTFARIGGSAFPTAAPPATDAPTTGREPESRGCARPLPGQLSYLDSLQ